MLEKTADNAHNSYILRLVFYPRQKTAYPPYNKINPDSVARRFDQRFDYRFVSQGIYFYFYIPSAAGSCAGGFFVYEFYYLAPELQGRDKQTRIIPGRVRSRYRIKEFQSVRAYFRVAGYDPDVCV
jgi:hypothetical protein